MALLTVIISAVSLTKGWRVADAVLIALPVCLLALPEILVGLGAPTLRATPSGATAFAVSADSPGGVIGSVLTLGGVWAPGAGLAARATATALVAELLLVVVAVCSWWFLRRDPPLRRPADLALAAYGPVVFAVFLLAGPMLPLWRSLQVVPGVALLWDTHATIKANIADLGSKGTLLAFINGPLTWIGILLGLLLIGARPAPDRCRGILGTRSLAGRGIEG